MSLIFKAMSVHKRNCSLIDNVGIELVSINRPLFWKVPNKYVRDQNRLTFYDNPKVNSLKEDLSIKTTFDTPPFSWASTFGLIFPTVFPLEMCVSTEHFPKVERVLQPSHSREVWHHHRYPAQGFYPIRYLWQIKNYI